MTVPSGPHVLRLLPDLRRALDGTGPALLPLGENDPRAADLARGLDAGEPLAPGEDDPRDPTALVMPTSGSTGTPKGVLLSRDQLAASAEATERRLGGAGHWLLALPAHHIAGMQVLLRAARADTEPVVLDTATPFTASGFAAAVGRVPGPRRYVSLVPTQLRRILADPAATAATAESFDAVLVGGSATAPELLAAARGAGIRVTTTYGMTETCGGCVYDGVPLDGASAALGPTGAVLLRGPMVARGYRGRPGDPAFPRPGSYVTADTGTIDTDGRLTITGRIDDIIVTGGVNVAPGPVERALAAVPGIAEALVVGVPDSEWGQAVAAVIVPDYGAAARGTGGALRAGRVGHENAWAASDIASLRATLADLPAAHRPRLVVTVDAIPQLASGKPDRAAARALVARSAPTLG